MVFAAILAGGTGTRMHLPDMPKQFLTIEEKPIIVHTIEKFLMCKEIDVIYIGIHKDFENYMKDQISSFNLGDENKIKVVAGGEDRNSTLFNVVDAIEREFKITEEDVIVTHDAVRPFLTLRIIEENVKVAKEFGACDTVVSATDTIVSSKDGLVITEIPERKNLYQGQTPQTFRIKFLKECYDNLSEEEKLSLTDACSILTHLGKEVRLVKGEPSNIKLTTWSDFEIAKALVGREKI